MSEWKLKERLSPLVEKTKIHSGHFSGEDFPALTDPDIFRYKQANQKLSQSCSPFHITEIVCVAGVAN